MNLMQLIFRFECAVLNSVLRGVSRASKYVILDSKYFKLLYTAIYIRGTEHHN
jgi:hypothetical protein